MFSKLEEVESRFERIQQELQEPGIANDQDKYRNLMKELSSLQDVVRAFREYKKNLAEISGNKEILEHDRDEDLRDLAKEELAHLVQVQDQLQRDLQLLLLPKDPADEKDVILEIRAGAGGDEASLFAAELFAAYSHYSSNRGWKVNLISASPGNLGGYREIIASIAGDRVYSNLKFESGVHRVQRVPKTESQGRIHTSTVTVAILPEADEVSVKIDPNDLRIDVFRSSGHGGQSVNTTESAVRVTHIPSGLVVSCQDGKSQLSNKEQALKVLYSRLLALEEEKARKEASTARLAQMGTGDRSERIRTYNFPQSRITDHRVGLTIHQLNEVLAGDMEPIIDPLKAHFQAELLKQQGLK
ncbi:MAG: peptide chain release factor 1 [Bdellovibrionales bacterium]|nr:peptide chain release factor 1 [Bdellovibrionales bacterium]